jgi:hypothetical protein
MSFILETRSHKERHLKVLCHRHNGLQAEQVCGAELIRCKWKKKGIKKTNGPWLPIEKSRGRT